MGKNICPPGSRSKISWSGQPRSLFQHRSCYWVTDLVIKVKRIRNYKVKLIINLDLSKLLLNLLIHNCLFIIENFILNHSLQLLQGETLGPKKKTCTYNSSEIMQITVSNQYHRCQLKWNSVVTSQLSLLIKSQLFLLSPSLIKPSFKQVQS